MWVCLVYRISTRKSVVGIEASFWVACNIQYTTSDWRLRIQRKSLLLDGHWCDGILKITFPPRFPCCGKTHLMGGHLVKYPYSCGTSLVGAGSIHFSSVKTNRSMFRFGNHIPPERVFIWRYISMKRGISFYINITPKRTLYSKEHSSADGQWRTP